MAKPSTTATGDERERIAAAHWKQPDFEIVQLKARCGDDGEIDIIARVANLESRSLP